jgi:hypothetical protein
MTEAEWVACDDPTPMLEFLRGKVSDRKLRLFACACCRPVESLLQGWWEFQGAVATAEKYGEGSATADRLGAAWDRVRHYPLRPGAVDSVRRIAVAAVSPQVGDALLEASHALTCDDRCFGILRDVFGNPFRRPVISRSCLEWNDWMVLRIAQTTYEERRFADLPILADALEDAGCTDSDILTHCRTPGEHVRGCWVIDLLLGKQ